MHDALQSLYEQATGASGEDRLVHFRALYRQLEHCAQTSIYGPGCSEENRYRFAQLAHHYCNAEMRVAGMHLRLSRGVFSTTSGRQLTVAQIHQALEDHDRVLVQNGLDLIQLCHAAGHRAEESEEPEKSEEPGPAH